SGERRCGPPSAEGQSARLRLLARWQVEEPCRILYPRMHLQSGFCFSYGGSEAIRSVGPVRFELTTSCTPSEPSSLGIRNEFANDNSALRFPLQGDSAD